MSTFSPGTRLSAQSAADNQWYKAFVILTEGDYCCVKYNAYPDIEWLPSDRLQLTSEFEGHEEEALVSEQVQNYAQSKNISKPEFTPEAYRKPEKVTQAAASYGKADLYIVSDGYLYAVDTQTGEREALPNSYSKTNHLCQFKGSIYAVNDGYLYRIDPATGDKNEVKGLSFSQTTFMSAGEDFIYAIIGGYLYRIDPEKPTKEAIGKAGWDKAQAICS
jgi:hypothetical protein